MSRLSFSPGNHTYWVADPSTGKKGRLPSVTTILKQLDKPALVKWAARAAGEYAADHWDELGQLKPSERARVIAGAPWQAKDRAAASGTAIHALAERLMAGEPVEVPEDLAPKVESVARWLERNPITGHAEVRVWSDPDEDLGLCGYAGTADLLGTCRRWGRVLVDWKTGSGVYPEHGVQLAAYASAEWLAAPDGDVRMPPVDTLIVAHVTPAGVDAHRVDPDGRALAQQQFELLRMLKLIDAPTLQMETP